MAPAQDPQKSGNSAAVPTKVTSRVGSPSSGRWDLRSSGAGAVGSLSSVFTTLAAFGETAPERELRQHIDALAALEEPRDEVGFLARVSVAEQIARLTMRAVGIVPVEPGPHPLLMAKTGAEFLRLSRTARVRERFACDWEDRVQEMIPRECGLRFYIDREMVRGVLRIGFRFGVWDTARAGGGR